MRRRLWLIVALVATTASARLTTFEWQSDPSWPTGTTVELCSNGVCANGIVGTQHTLDVPIEPGGQFDARARAVTVDGQFSDWTTLFQTWPADPVGTWARFDEEQQMAVAANHLTGGETTASNPSSTASITPTANAQVLLSVGVSTSSPNFDVGDYGTLSVSGCGLTWQQVAVQSGAGIRRAQFLWRGTAASPSTGAITITYTPPAGRTWTSSKWSVDEFTGLDSTTPLGTPVVAGAFGASSSTTLAAPSAGDWAYAAVTLSANQDSTRNSELDTDLYELGDAAALSLIHVGVDTSPDTNPTPGFTFAASVGWNQIGVLLKVGAASAAAGLPRRALDGPLFGALRGSVR